MKNKIIVVLATLFLIPADILFFFSPKREMIKKDLDKYSWETPFKDTSVIAFNYCMVFIRPFRNIFYYRVKRSFILKNISRLFFPPLHSIEIRGEIAGGFRIPHNYAVVGPDYAGENLYVCQGVTVGIGKPNTEGRRFPIIGNNVEIYVNAVVFGGITIGNNVKIGAGAVVNRDVPDNCTVVGNPCRIIESVGNNKDN